MIISVAGAHSGIGKTTLCSILLKELKGFGAIKFTKTEFYTAIVDDVNILSQPGKDTAIFLESGAEKVIWIQCPKNALGDALQIVLSQMADLKGIIVEGNSPVDFLNPHLLIFIVDAGEIKPSAQEIIGKADFIIMTSAEKVPSLKLKNDTVVFRVDLKKRTGELNEFLTVVKERIERQH